MTKRDILEVPAVYIECRTCGLNYIEEKEWLFRDGKTECPYCRMILRLL